MMTPTLATLITELQHQGLLTAREPRQIERMLTHQPLETAHASPWFISVFIGLSAWLASLFFLGFIAFLGVIDTPETAIVVGGLLVLMTSVLAEMPPSSLFLNQVTLVGNLSGQLLLIGGIGFKHDLITAAAATLMTECLLIVLYPQEIRRFLAILIATVAVLVLCYEFRIVWGVHALIFILATGAVVCWLGESYYQSGVLKHLYQPLGYGCVVALWAVLLLSIMPQHYQLMRLTHWYPSTLGLLSLLLITELFILRYYQISWRSHSSLIILMASCVVALLLSSAPGVIAAVLIILLGFQRGQRPLLGLAFIFLSLFFMSYYYYLDITLLMKSLSLVIAGALLLTLRFFLKSNLLLST
ncbi:MAG: DUF4401 domain-containing protein [Pseudomonadota bacterium]|nr:DUF4401 domain-containing protein [Pseudomonadota bacterium]